MQTDLASDTNGLQRIISIISTCSDLPCFIFWHHNILISEYHVDLLQHSLYPFFLLAQTEGADGPRLFRPALPLRVDRAEARLFFCAAVSIQQHVC